VLKAANVPSTKGFHQLRDRD